MSDAITKLLEARETGQVDRRQLLQALGLGATGAFLAGALPDVAGSLAAQARGGKSFPVTTVNHLSYACGPD